MRVLLDHCVPKPLGFLLTGHYVRTTHFMGWDELINGRLLAAAASHYDAFLTVDRNISSEQRLDTLPLPIITLIAVSNDLPDLEPHVPEVLLLLAHPLEKRVYFIRGDTTPRTR